MNAARPSARLRIKPLYRLQWEEAQQAFVLLFPEGMIKLNDAAGQILKRCDGTLDVDGMVADLEAQFTGSDLRQDVLEFLEVAHERGWIEET